MISSTGAVELLALPLVDVIELNDALSMVVEELGQSRKERGDFNGK